MSLLVVGLSHRSAPVEVLECAALNGDEVTKLLDEVHLARHVSEAAVLATCNRVEVYADVDKFHGGVDEISELLARYSGLDLETLSEHLYVHYEDRAVHHLFSVACGLDSMVVGESQVLGQVKSALRLAQEADTTGRVLNGLFQAALRVGKRAQTETGIDRLGRSLVTVGLSRLEPVLGGLAGRRALVVGAGSMAALAASTLRRMGIGELAVANRTFERAQRLAAAVDAEVVRLSDLPTALPGADVLVSCTGANGVVVPYDLVAVAASQRNGRPLAILDLALPHDVDPAVADLPGVTLSPLSALADAAEGAEMVEDINAVRALVDEEVSIFAGSQRAARVAPTVVALRSMADEVVGAELTRLSGRLADVDPSTWNEVANTVRRVVDKLLHAPTVRVKELAADPGGADYEAALRKLFALDPRTIDAVSKPEREEGDEQ